VLETPLAELLTAAEVAALQHATSPEGIVIRPAPD
jgi:hypothetical protein